VHGAPNVATANQLKAPSLAALWFTQPDKLQSLLDERSLNEGGLIPRILACHTNAQLRTVTPGANL
jgi:hypothetical protein